MVALMGITACEKEAETVEVAVSESATTVTTETIKETPVEEEPEEFQINPVEVEAPFENEKAEAFAQEIFQKEIKNREDFILERERQPYIWDRQVFTDTSGKKLYYFCVSISFTGQDDPMYIFKETTDGMQVVWDGYINPRSKFYIYEGAYLQHVGSSSAFDEEEDLCVIEDGIKTIYSYGHGYFGDYLLNPEMNRNYEKESELYKSLIEDLKKAGLSEEEINGIEFQRMDIGDKSFLQVALSGTSGFKRTVYGATAASELSKVVTVAAVDSEFFRKCKDELDAQGYDIIQIYCGKILAGYAKEKESLVWDMNSFGEDGVHRPYPKIRTGNPEFDKCINSTVELYQNAEVEKVECLEEDSCYRVAIRLPLEEGGYRHVGDFFFVRNDGIKSFPVYYESLGKYNNLERDIRYNCDFNAKYEDVTFDGIKDITISLGYDGEFETYCAYVYWKGEYVYNESFEKIGDYKVNKDEKTIVDGNNNVYVFKDMWDDGIPRIDGSFERVYKETIEDEAFKAYVDGIATISGEETITDSYWVADDVIYRVFIMPDDSGSYEESEKIRDYFFIYGDKPSYFQVTYPSFNESPRSDRYLWECCDFSAEYRDVNFDGHKDIVIFLGYGGTSAATVHCAYLYKNGKYVYCESFEDILSYSVNYKEKYLGGWFFDGPYYYEQKAVYKNGEFIVEDYKVN